MIYLQQYKEASPRPIIEERYGKGGVPEIIFHDTESFGASGGSLPTTQSGSPIGDMRIVDASYMVKDDYSSEEKIKSKVVGALERSGCYWRAVDSVVKETDISEDEVKATLKRLIRDRQVVVAPRRDSQGRVLYTTRKHYRETRGILTKILSALANQIV